MATPVNGASLSAFRIALGVVMALEACSLCLPNRAAISTGATPLETYYTGPDIKFHFPYEGFEWLPLLPAQWIYALVVIQVLAGVSMALGFCYRASAATVFLTWAYLWLVESTRTYWQSHFYLETLLTFLMIWMPAGRRASIDAWLVRGRNPPTTVPFWTILLLRGQLVIAYFYAGVAKLNADWLLDAVPVRWFLTNPTVTAPFAPYLTSGQLDFFNGMLHRVELAYFFSYAGLGFDLAIGFLLLIRRTRTFAMILMVLFHATNHLLIFDDIGWFPLVGVTTALIFLDPDWPERFWAWLKRPRLKRPDWNWFTAGAIAFPIVGAALGWKAKQGQHQTDSKALRGVGNGTALFVAVWLVWQMLMPLRQYWIPGDGRFTYEGQSFSWRLKTDLRHSFGHQIFVRDPAIIPSEGTNQIRINWNQWHGERVIYRRVTPGQINWELLPEIVVLLEPIGGERIVYNPLNSHVRTEAEARDRVLRLWQELYGRRPQVARRTGPLSLVLDSISAGLRSGGHNPEATRLASFIPRAKQLEQDGLEPQQATKTRSEIQKVLNELYHRNQAGEMLPFLRSIDPFALEGERHRPVPFLLIEDSYLLDPRTKKINRAAWKNGPHTGAQNLGAGADQTGPLVIHVGDLGVESRDLLPQACIFDVQDHPEQPPYIYWNSLKDLTASKFLHVSIQAFYLRRYARRVAALWEKEYARRPAVNAVAKMSLNGRAHQDLVDPTVDLASVPRSWFGHNPWIRDLETTRIPREALAGRSNY